MATEKWPTAITRIEPGKIHLRGYNITELMEKLTFAQTIFLTLRGELPTEAEGKMMEAILVSSVDHGVTPPSVLAARTVASGGNPLNAAVAALKLLAKSAVIISGLKSAAMATKVEHSFSLYGEVVEAKYRPSISSRFNPAKQSIAASLAMVIVSSSLLATLLSPLIEPLPQASAIASRASRHNGM